MHPIKSSCTGGGVLREAEKIEDANARDLNLTDSGRTAYNMPLHMLYHTVPYNHTMYHAGQLLNLANLAHL